MMSTTPRESQAFFYGGLQSPWERRLPACAKSAEWSLRSAQVGCLRTHRQAGSLRSQEKSDFAILLVFFYGKKIKILKIGITFFIERFDNPFVVGRTTSVGEFYEKAILQEFCVHCGKMVKLCRRVKE